ncbi:MAG: hypothetical protein KBD10_00965 [Candidatus Pacebacteria bacterium]|nr:hypothetical protein [Candidatus Paceibacterota bacterium]
MKKREVTIQFIFKAIESNVNLVGTAKKRTGSVCIGGLEQSCLTTMPHRSFTLEQYKGWEGVRALDDDQIDQIFQEMIDEVTGREEVELMFTFDLRRGQRGHIYLSQDNRLDNSKTTDEMLQRNRFVVTQLVRFGYIDKLKSTRSNF